MKLHRKVQDEILRCAEDFLYFACNYLYVVDNREDSPTCGQLVLFKMNRAQRKILQALQEHPELVILKARQLGSTTLIAAYYFWLALFRPHHRVLVVAHTHQAAESIFDKYLTFYSSLPSFLRFKRQKENVRELRFFHEGGIKVTSAGSDDARGSTYQSLHLSEVAFWRNPDKAIASILQTAAPSASIVYESTANGLGYFHDMWNASDLAHHKLFLSWMDNEDYTSKTKPKVIPKVIEEYGRKLGLSKGQLYWITGKFLSRCNGDMNMLNQEFPSEPSVAFIVSGSRFFSVRFPYAKVEEGYRQYADPNEFRVYSLGADPAGGNPDGDYSSFVVTDVTDKDAPSIVARHYVKIPVLEFAERIYQETTKWKNILCVVESNNQGPAVVEALSAKGVALYRRTVADKAPGKKGAWLEKLGFATDERSRWQMLSRLQEYVSKGNLVIQDPTIQAEMNAFVWQDGKPQAESGKHDDAIFALALALQGIDQIGGIEQQVRKRPPQSLEEIVRWEAATERLYDEADEEWAESMGSILGGTMPSQMGPR